MARVGTTIEHPVTGERIVFRETSATTNGELLRIDIFLRPGGFVAGEHVHPNADEYFEIVSGTGRFQVGDREWTVRRGGLVTVLRGTPHRWWNAGEDELHAVIDFCPALRMEQFFENFFGLGKAGLTDSRGLPSLLQMAVMMREFEQEIRATQPPLPVQRAILPPLAAVGRWVGLRARYPEFETSRAGATQAPLELVR